jgi:hypothetical protein
VSAASLQPLELCTAFWLALWLHDRQVPRHTTRFAAALVLGAVFARLGPTLLFEAPGAARFDPFGAVSVLFVPLGIVLLFPAAAAFSSLPLPLALARVGCIAAGCCQGRAGILLPIADAAAFCVLHWGARRLSPRWIPAVFLIAFGALRVSESSWRGEAVEVFARVAPSRIAALWMVVGFVAAGVAWWRSGWIHPETRIGNF